jgi:hypothetical protein
LKLRQRSLSVGEQRKIESFAANVNDDLLGLTEVEYLRIQSQATAVIHVRVLFQRVFGCSWLKYLLPLIQNAWPVNFVLEIDSFDEHVGGALNLINFCLCSAFSPQPSFFFSSSVGTRQGAVDAVCAEDFPTSPDTASPTGYARSKWVVEKVVQRAAIYTPIKVGVFRIGQLVGDTEK